MRGRRVLSDDEAAFVDAQRVARMATVSPDGTPHVAPICPVLDGDRIVVASGTASAKVRNLRRQPRLAIVFDEYLEDWGLLKHAVVFGEATLVEEGPRFERGRALLYEKYPQYPREDPIEEGKSVCIEVSIARVAAMGFE
ncbi:MAG: pyridoxamine 5'-phosphate oxidase family protein [Actinobacteria bacterium]|nr:pyridoxamine 5'-phosphate oxidase family protein [Actinomycetota bacterium]